MKKFSKVKYFGAVAAALLAVAPVAAPVVSSIASPAVVKADTNDQAKLDYALVSSVTIGNGRFNNVAALTNFLGGTQTDFVTSPDTPVDSDLAFSNDQPTLLRSILRTVEGHTTADAGQLKNYKLQFTFDGYAGPYTPAKLANDLLASGKHSFTVLVKLYANTDKTFSTPLATKAVNLTVAQASVATHVQSVAVSDATANVGSNLAALTSYSSIASATTITDTTGATRAATVADFNSYAGYTQSTDLANITPTVGRPTSAGTYYLLFSLANPSGTPSTSIALRKSATNVYYVARKVVVGDYSEASASGTANVVNGQGTTVYSDPTTTTSTGKTLDYGSAWKVYGVVKNSAGTVLAYNLGGKQYVKASDVSSTAVSNQAGVFTVKYPSNPTWSIAVYNSDLKVQKLIPAGSTWTTFGVKTLKDGKSYYNVGGDQWVRTDYGYWNAK
ncbi:SLAP domain-containing protein [Schleiferilactobacillus harbinensis]|uniref:SLAP domain-containing protein n=1 Tax=Schleiferilactobacillus harbinensis TaxID=304207 RepID=UPI0007B82ECE|nr:SLAP domain-containing protein [Schleiferilactobacillus harbinensis]